jgi:hypothetical protein
MVFALTASGIAAAAEFRAGVGKSDIHTSADTGPEIEVPVVLMRIGDIALVGLQAELAASVGVQLKAKSPFSHTIVVTMVDGGAYMPDAKAMSALHTKLATRGTPVVQRNSPQRILIACSRK